jgi:hypothetical protein
LALPPFRSAPPLRVGDISKSSLMEDQQQHAKAISHTDLSDGTLLRAASGANFLGQLRAHHVGKFDSGSSDIFVSR